AFKRLLGETSLERKCRFLFGTGIFVLIWLSFWLYAYQTEHLAYDQAIVSCRLLVSPILAQKHLPKLQAKPDTQADGKAPMDGKQLQDALNMVDVVQGKEYQYHILSDPPFDDIFESNLYKEFLKSDSRTEESRLKATEQVLLY